MLHWMLSNQVCIMYEEKRVEATEKQQNVAYQMYA